MSLFLFLKQIVDMLYPFQWLDYAMVLMALVALTYQILLVRPSVKKAITVTDICILVYAALLVFHFILQIFMQNGQAVDYRVNYGTFVKPLSALLLYFVGRIYYERIQECGAALAASSYIVVYANFIYRLITHWGDFFRVKNAGGDLYYYDTDMAYAMLIALIFILMYGRNSVLKVITFVFTIPYMVICSDAGIQKVLLIAIAILMVLYLLEKFGVPGKVSNTLLITAVVGLLLIVGDVVLPSAVNGKSIILDNFSGKWLDAGNLYNSYPGWHKGWQTVLHASFPELLLGMFQQGEVHGNLYVRCWYTTGILGSLCLIVMVAAAVLRIVKMEDRKTCYVTLLLGLVILGTGVTTRCMEFTQMTWFVFMFLGMTVSSLRKITEAEDAEQENR